MSDARSRRRQSARKLEASGYALAESIDWPGLFYVHKPGRAVPYVVNLRRGRKSCDCADFRTRLDYEMLCKHLEFVRLCLRAVRGPGVVVVRRRRLFSVERMERVRGFARLDNAAVQSSSV